MPAAVVERFGALIVAGAALTVALVALLRAEIHIGASHEMMVITPSGGELAELAERAALAGLDGLDGLAD
jgi:hypothetical protein